MIKKNLDDGMQRLKLINNDKESHISYYYIEVKAQDVNHDGIDEILCSKYIPGQYRADVLGFIQYSFHIKNGKYSLYSESFKLDGKILGSKYIDNR